MPREIRPRVGRAFAPAHVTGIFAPSLEARDPRGRGSVGAGIVLEAGVEAVAWWWPSRRASVRLEADVRRKLPISEDVARRLLAHRRGRLILRLKHDLPIGQGFGMSAAGALATALAVAAATGQTRRVAVETAHLADLYGGGGLGGVSAILGGGVETRERPGIPPWGRARHTAATGRVLVAWSRPSIPSPRLLRDPAFLRRVTAAAGPGLRRLMHRPDLRSLMREAERFTDTLALGPASLLRQVHALRSPDVAVVQAMFGRSLVLVPWSLSGRAHAIRGLEHQGLHAVELPIARRGARIVPH